MNNPSQTKDMTKPTNVVGEKVCTRCSKGKQYDSNGLCIKCNFNKMMGGEVV